jgi:hypothetical protein
MNDTQKSEGVKVLRIPLSQIELNKGQIEGLPKNPRFIRDEKFAKLVQSITDNPEMLDLRELLVYPYNGKYVLIGGNMRYRALQELKYKDAPCKVIPQSATVEQLKAYTLKDNSGFGQWDFDLLANEWDVELLDMCAIDVPNLNMEDFADAQELSDKSANELGDAKEHTNLNIQLESSEEYATVIDTIMSFDDDLRLGLLKALGLSDGGK